MYNFYLLHNENYVVDFFFARFNTAKALIFVFVYGGFLPFPSCIFSSCSRYCDRGCQPSARYPFASYNKCARKGDGGYAETPSFPTHSPPYITFSYHSKYSIYQADCHSSSRTRCRFLFFALCYTVSRSDKVASAKIPACACLCS